MGFVEEARAARAAAEGARAAYRGRVARAERSFLEARETRAESERSLEDALGSALLIARSKSLRLYPDRIECKGEAIRLGEVLGIDAEMEGSILQKVSEDLNNWSKSIRTIDKRTAVVTVRTPEWECSVRTGPGQEANARRFMEAARDVLADPGRYREWRDARLAGMPGVLARADAARAAEAAAWSALAAARADTRAVGDAGRSSRRSWHRLRRTTSPCLPRPTGKGPGALRSGRAPSPSASRSWARFWRSRSSPPSPQPFPPSPGPPSWTASGAAWRRPSRGPRSRRPRPRRAQVAPFHLRRAAADGSFITSLLSFLRPGTVRPAIVWPWISSHGRLLFAMFPRCCASFSARTAGVPQTRHISWCVRCHPKGVHTTGQTMMV